LCLSVVDVKRNVERRGTNHMDEAKMARTESAYREVNEAIASLAARFESDEAEFVCECADVHCAHRITADLEDYEEVRSEATQFIIAPGHDEPAIERIVERSGEYHVVEKFGAGISHIVRRLNPRAKPA
jgi:hypothetical protein